MNIGAKKLVIGKWQFRFTLGMNPPWLTGFSPWVVIHFAKFIKYPPPGALPTKEEYKGLIWEYVVPFHRLTLVAHTIRIAQRNFLYWVDVFYDKND